MLCRTLLWFVGSWLAPAGVALASAEEQAAGGENNATPNVFSGDLGTAVWTLLIFIVLLLILGKWAWGPILAGLKKREDHIRQSITDAEKARADAEKSLAEYKSQLARAKEEAAAIITQGRNDAVQLAEQLKQQAQTDARALTQRAEQDIAGAKDQALKEIFDQTADLATKIAGQIISKNLNPEDHRNLVQQSLNKLQNGTHQN
jgi:F-type H+-transporting ATPase subunit b